MTLQEEISRISSVFIDTAPIIYFIEAHPQYGPLVRNIINTMDKKKVKAFSSVITIAEVLPKPIQAGKKELASKFVEFLKKGENLTLIHISVEIAEKAGQLRGKYSKLKALDAIQLAAALVNKVDAFLTNDVNLKQITEIRILLLRDFL